MKRRISKSQAAQADTIQVSDKSVSLIGFALKSKQLVNGYEAVCKSVIKNKIEFVLVKSDISDRSLRKLTSFLQQYQISVYKTLPQTDWHKLWGMERWKIIGFHKGKLGRTILQNFNSGV